jgi:hypothetical protein
MSAKNEEISVTKVVNADLFHLAGESKASFNSASELLSKILESNLNRKFVVGDDALDQYDANHEKLESAMKEELKSMATITRTKYAVYMKADEENWKTFDQEKAALETLKAISGNDHLDRTKLENSPNYYNKNLVANANKASIQSVINFKSTVTKISAVPSLDDDIKTSTKKLSAEKVTGNVKSSKEHLVVVDMFSSSDDDEDTTRRPYVSFKSESEELVPSSLSHDLSTEVDKDTTEVDVAPSPTEGSSKDQIVTAAAGSRTKRAVAINENVTVTEVDESPDRERHREQQKLHQIQLAAEEAVKKEKEAEISLLEAEAAAKESEATTLLVQGEEDPTNKLKNKWTAQAKALRKEAEKKRSEATKKKLAMEKEVAKKESEKREADVAKRNRAQETVARQKSEETNAAQIEQEESLVQQIETLKRKLSDNTSKESSQSLKSKQQKKV